MEHSFQFKIGLIGENISASLTPELHMEVGHMKNLNYHYRRIDILSDIFREQSLAEILTQAQKQGLCGFNITHPFKKDIIALLSDCSDEVQKIGSCNTVTIQNGKYIGYNTDYFGFYKAFEKNFKQEKKDIILMLGAGGAGAAVAFALLDHGVKSLYIYDLNNKAAYELKDKLDLFFPNQHIHILHHLDDIDMIDGIVNATAVGMSHHPGSPINLNNYPKNIWVADIIYFPRETALILTAKVQNRKVMTGFDMAIFQAVKSFEIFTGQTCNYDNFIKAYKQLKIKI